MTQTSASHRLGDRSRLAARLVALAFALAGLFAMHGLGDHGAAHQGSHDAVAASAMVAANHAAPPETDANEAGAFVGMPEGDSSTLVMASVCLAVLAGALVGFLLLRVLRTVRFTGRRAWLSFATTPLAALRERDPPCLFELSIQRC